MGRRETMADLPQPLDVIAVGAHPDDVEIGCGGTLALLAAQGHRVGIVDLTDGEPTPRSSGPEERLARGGRRGAGARRGAPRDARPSRIGGCSTTFEIRVALATIFRRWRPRLVLGLGDKTPLASPDHAQAVAITEAAVFYSRLTKWDDAFAGLPVHTVPQFLTYFLFAGLPQRAARPLAAGGRHRRPPGDEARSDRLLQDRSFRPRRPTCFPRVRAMAETVGMMAGCEAGEVLASSRMPLTVEPLRMLFPPGDRAT